MGEASAACSSSSLHGFGAQKMKYIRQRKAVLLGQRDVQAVIGGRSLQLEIEAAAETLAQRQPPGLVDAPAEGRMNHQLHAAALVEKALGDDGLLRRHRTQHGAALQNVFHCLLGTGVIQPAFLFQPGNGFRNRRLVLRNADGRNSGKRR